MKEIMLKHGERKRRSREEERPGEVREERKGERREQGMGVIKIKTKCAVWFSPKTNISSTRTESQSSHQETYLIPTVAGSI